MALKYKEIGRMNAPASEEARNKKLGKKLITDWKRKDIDKIELQEGARGLIWVAYVLAPQE